MFFHFDFSSLSLDSFSRLFLGQFTLNTYVHVVVIPLVTGRVSAVPHSLVAPLDGDVAAFHGQLVQLSDRFLPSKTRLAIDEGPLSSVNSRLKQDARDGAKRFHHFTNRFLSGRGGQISKI